MGLGLLNYLHLLGAQTERNTLAGVAVADRQAGRQCDYSIEVEWRNNLLPRFHDAQKSTTT